MKPQQFRDVAWALDALTELTRCLLEPVAAMESMNAETLDVTVQVTRSGGKPMSPADAQKILDWVKDDAMQQDLRAFADQVAQLERVVEKAREVTARRFGYHPPGGSFSSAIDDLEDALRDLGGSTPSSRG